MIKHNKLWKFLSYGTLGLPVSFLGLPLYVFLPKYLTSVGLSLVAISSLILITRLFDAVQDPVLGNLFNKIKTIKTRSALVILGLICLMPIVWFLFSSDHYSYGELLGILIILYTFYSIVLINYYAIAAEVPSKYSDKTTITSCREGFFLVGVLLFSSVPIFLKKSLDDTSFYQTVSTIFMFVCLGSILLYLYFHISLPKITYNPSSVSWLTSLKNTQFLKLAFLYFLSTLASSIPGALFIFYVKDLLGGTDQQVGQFLLVYFLSAIIGLPLWGLTGKYYSKRRIWIMATGLAILSFIWAFWLVLGDFMAFYIICFFSGMALGADLAIPPSILADQVSKGQESTTRYFGVWAFVSKSAMAVGAAGALYSLSNFGYEDGGIMRDLSKFGLSFSYALLPCILKLLFLGLLIYYKKIGLKNA